jgi:hypothetical protein
VIRIAFFLVSFADIEARLAALEKERAASKEGTQFTCFTSTKVLSLLTDNATAATKEGGAGGWFSK